MDRELEEFRSQWVNEVTEQQLVRRGSAATSGDATPVIDENASPEAQAMQIFQLGADKERAGLFYDAITLYKRALAMDGNVETKIADLERKQQHQQGKIESTKPVSRRVVAENSTKSDKIALDAMLKIILSESLNFVCEKADRNKNPTEIHISQLPLEVVTLVLNHVVSSELDFYSLERVACVSRGFYRLARTSDIWHAGCMRIWRNTNLNIPSGYRSWREMYLQRPAVRFFGVYMSRVTYLRAGETSFVDKKASTYRPWQDVTFYRYFRFHPDGSCIMLISTDEPVVAVERLKPKFPAKSPEILTGCYHLASDTDTSDEVQQNILTLILHRREFSDPKKNRTVKNLRKNQVTFENFAYADELRLELVIHSGKSRRNVRLEWRRYEIERIYDNGKRSLGRIPINMTQFPALMFSRVKSYSAFDRCAPYVKSVVF